MTDPRQPVPGGTVRPAGLPASNAHPAHVPHPSSVPSSAANPSLRPGISSPQPSGRVIPAPSAQHPAHIDDSIALIEDGEDAEVLHKKIKAFGPEAAIRSAQFKRQPCLDGKGPVRVRTFHAKLSDQGLEYLDDAINHFIDEHPEVDVKFVTSNIGMFDGKFKDMALIVNVWY